MSILIFKNSHINQLWQLLLYGEQYGTENKWRFTTENLVRFKSSNPPLGSTKHNFSLKFMDGNPNPTKSLDPERIRIRIVNFYSF